MIIPFSLDCCWAGATAIVTAAVAATAAVLAVHLPCSSYAQAFAKSYFIHMVADFVVQKWQTDCRTYFY